MSAQPLSPTEAAVVARFDAAEPAPESWRGDDGLREALEAEVFAGVLRQITTDSDLHSAMYANLDPRPIVRELLALPEVAALRAKAAAADRVRELANDLVNEGFDLMRGKPSEQMVGGHLIATGNRIAYALDGPPC